MSGKSHNERCPDCKENVRNLLRELFGPVETNWDLGLPCQLPDYTDTNLYDTLRPIHEALQNNRNFEIFVKSKKLPRVDYFVPDRKLIVEFDESQHFTKPRDLALSFYPASENNFGFSVEKWRKLCQQLNKRDNDPPYRDEQRAWYDTIRDFAPVLWNAGQTARLYSRDAIWCSLSPDSESDLQTFRQLVEGRSGDQ